METAVSHYVPYIDFDLLLQQVDVDRLAVLGPHGALVHGLGRANGHAVAAVDAEVRPVRDRDGEILLGDQTARAGPDAGAAGDA